MPERCRCLKGKYRRKGNFSRHRRRPLRIYPYAVTRFARWRGGPRCRRLLAWCAVFNRATYALSWSRAVALAVLGCGAPNTPTDTHCQ